MLQTKHEVYWWLFWVRCVRKTKPQKPYFAKIDTIFWFLILVFPSFFDKICRDIAIQAASTHQSYKSHVHVGPGVMAGARGCFFAPEDCGYRYELHVEPCETSGSGSRHTLLLQELLTRSCTNSHYLRSQYY